MLKQYLRKRVVKVRKEDSEARSMVTGTGLEIIPAPEVLAIVKCTNSKQITR